MAPIATSATSVTALYKYYHSDRSEFYPIVTAALHYPDEFYAVTVHSDYITNSSGQTVVRFIKDTAGQQLSYDLRDTVNTAAPAAILGSTVGDLERLNDKIFYSNYDDEVKMIRVRKSSGDTASNLLYSAGIPDPNAKKVISRCEDTANWTYSAGGGSGDGEIDRAVSHRLEGDGALRFYQETYNKTATLTYSVTAATGAVINLDNFEDGTTSSATDFITFNIYRYDKKAIKELKVMFSTDNGGAFTNYFFVPLVQGENTDLEDNDESAPWSQWDFQQNTPMSQWGINPYDNQLFRIRVRKQWFAQVGSPPGWSSITTVRVSLVADSQASSDNPAMVTIDDIQLLKTPPIAKDYRVQWASFEEEEVGSTYGWLNNTATLTRCDFNRQLAKEGVSCLIVSGGNSTAGAAASQHPPASQGAPDPDHPH